MSLTKVSYSMITGAPVNVLDYGADPTGVTNSTAAFQAASAVIQANDGGKLVVPAGTYTVGSQTFAGAFGQGYSYRGARIIDIRNCTNPVVIEFQGAKLKLANGLKFGSFNPVTGAVYNPPSMPFTNADYAADVGVFIDVEENQNVSIVGSCELDGNIQNISLGGTWGDTGYQCVSYGILAYGNLILNIENVYTHHHALDGVALGWTGLTAQDPAKPTKLLNVVSEYNARQGISIVGGKGITLESCKFNFTGRSTFSSAPGAGIDFEAESSVVRNVTLINCETIGNTGVGFLADVGDNADISAYSCNFVGTTFYSIWPKMPRISFYDCLIVGACTNAYGDNNYADNATKFYNCLFTDFVSFGFGGATYNPGNLVDFNGKNILFNGCTIEAGRQKIGNIQDVTFENCQMTQIAGTNVGIANQDWVAYLHGAKFTNLSFLDDIALANRPADAYYIDLDGTEVYSGVNFLTTTTDKIRWFTWDAASGGSTGALGQNLANLAPFTRLSLGKSTGNRFIGFYGTIGIVSGPAAPTVDTWQVGDRCINSNPVVGQPKSWACTVAGTPGTWVSEGNL